MPAISIGERGIPLLRMQQLSEALDAGDDWTGLTDPKARRRMQNRLSSRAYRRRKALGKGTTGHIEPHGCCFSLQPHQAGRRLIDAPPDFVTLVSTYENAPGPTYPSMCDDRPNPSPSTSDVRSNGQLSITNDHLLSLIQMNVHRATLTNMALLSHTFQCGLRVSPPSLPDSIPPQLVPTPLQTTTPHPQWIDAFPLASMRENMINALGCSYDEDELLRDMVGSVYTDYHGREHCGFVVWTQPWDVSGWEVSPGFVRKWGRLMKGCEELVVATNRWRAARREDPLVPKKYEFW